MTNNLDTNPIFLDTFTADVDVSLDTGNSQFAPVILKGASIESNNALDSVVFSDKNDVEVLRLTAKDADVANAVPIGQKRVYSNGFKYDLSLSSVSGDCKVFLDV